MMKLSKEQTLLVLALLMLLKAGLYCFASPLPRSWPTPLVRLADRLSFRWEEEMLAVFREIAPLSTGDTAQRG